MNITIIESGTPFEKQDGWHVLAVAEGFSALGALAECDYGVDSNTVFQLIDEVNYWNETRSLHPKAPISAIPCKYFRELSDSTDPTVLNDFKARIKEFLTLNSKIIKAMNLIIEFHVSHSPVPQQYIDATREVLKSYRGKVLGHVIIYK